MRGSGFFPQEGVVVGVSDIWFNFIFQRRESKTYFRLLYQELNNIFRGGGADHMTPSRSAHVYVEWTGLLKLFLSLFSVHWFRCLWIPCGVHQHCFSLYSKTRLSRPVLVSKRWISSDVQDGLASIEAMLHPFQNVLLRRKWSDFPLITTHRQRRVYIYVRMKAIAGVDFTQYCVGFHSLNKKKNIKKVFMSMLR